MEKNETKTLNPGLLEALASIGRLVEVAPGTSWRPGGDDLCDCTFQTVWEVTNPYIGKTQRVRLCCILDKMQHLFPEFVALLDGWHDVGRQKLVSEPLAWDHDEMAMPPRLWMRQLATQQGKSLWDIRREYGQRLNERPAAGAAKVFQPATVEELWQAREDELRATGWID